MAAWLEPRAGASRTRRPLLFPAFPLVLLAPMLAGCGGDYSPNTYASRAVQQANKVEQGVVVGVRPVDIRADGTTGAAAGVAAGSLAGSTIGTGSTASAFGAIGGGVVGGLLGTAAERAAGDAKGFEYIIRKPNNDLLSVAQTDAVPLLIGQKVLVITGSQARVLPDYTVNTADSGQARKPEANTAPAGDALPAPGAAGTAVPPTVPVQSVALPPPEAAAASAEAANGQNRTDQSVFPSFPALPR